MNCKQVSRLLDAYADGQLPAGSRGQVDEHLRSCGQCRHEAEEIGRVAAMLRQATEPSQALESRVLLAVASSERASSSDSGHLEKKKMTRKTFQYGFATVLTLCLITTLVLSLPSAASAAWEQMESAVARIRTAKTTVIWKNEDGSRGSKIVYSDATRVRFEYTNGAYEIFANGRSYSSGQLPHEAMGDAMGSIDPAMFNISTQVKMIARGEQPVELGKENWQGTAVTLLAVSPPDKPDQRFVFWVASKTDLPVRTVVEVKRNGTWEYESEMLYQFDLPLEDSLFAIPK